MKNTEYVVLLKIDQDPFPGLQADMEKAGAILTMLHDNNKGPFTKEILFKVIRWLLEKCFVIGVDENGRETIRGKKTV